MFALLDLFSLVYVLVNPGLTMRTVQDVAIDPTSQIVQFSARKQSPGFDQSKKCVYTGVAVALGDPPAADAERKSFGILVTKESCPDKTPQPILHVAKAQSSNPSVVYMGGMKVETSDFFTMKPEDRPTWLTEAVTKVHSEAKTKETAAITFDNIAAAVTMRVFAQKQVKGWSASNLATATD